MRKFARDLLAFATLVACLYGIFVAVVPRGESRPGGVLEQERRLDAYNGPRRRIIFAGGSGVPYGIVCDLFEEGEAAAFNLGWHAGLGLPMHLEQALHHIRKGDVVVVMPEHMQWNNDVIGMPVFEYVAASPDQLDLVPASYYRYLSDKSAEYLSYELKVRVKNLVQGTGASATNRNQCGSYIDHYGEPYQGFNTTPRPLDRVDVASMQATASLLAEASIRARNKGADLFVAFPPVPEPLYESWSDQLDQIVAVTRRTSVKILTLPQAYPLEQFYDTSAHLNEAGARRYSAEVADALAREGVLLEKPE